MFLQSLIDHIIGRSAIQSSGHAATTTVVTETQTAPKVKTAPKEGLRFYLNFFRQDKPALVGLVIAVLFVAWGALEGIMQELATLLRDPALGWALLPSSPFALTFNSKLEPPSLKDFPYFLLGTNQNGQSILSRLLYATPHDVEAPIVVVGSALLIGMFLGTAAGYFGGWTDELIMRLTDAFLSLPPLILAITVGVLLGATVGGFGAILVALAVVWWPTYARFFRAQALAIRDRGYVESSKLSGSGSLRVLVRHIVPNSIDPVIAYMTLDFGTVILFLSSLAFLGVGVTITYPEWGAESSLGLTFFPEYWWYAIMPGIVIAIIVIAFTLIGDRLQDLISGRISY